MADSLRRARHARAMRNGTYWTPSSLPIACRPIAFEVGIMLAYKLAVLRASEIALALEVVDVGPSVDPHEPVARTCHAGRRGMRRRLCPAGGNGTDGKRDGHDGGDDGSRKQPHRTRPVGRVAGGIAARPAPTARHRPSPISLGICTANR